MSYCTQNELLLSKLMQFYKNDNNIEKILPIINGSSNLSIRIIDWFVTNYSKEYFVVYTVQSDNGIPKRFKVYTDYKLKLKAYSKKRFDPFCRWERIVIPYKKDADGNDTYIQTTIGQLNFFKWALEYNIIDYIQEHVDEICEDMNQRNGIHKKSSISSSKKREELSVSPTKSIKKEYVEAVVQFD